MNNQPEQCDVSVIIPAYQSAAVIGQALSSVAKQTVKPREVIVVIDGHEPDTQANAENLAPALLPSTLIVIAQDHAGAGAARNRALQAATSKYAAFLDADDTWSPEKLAVSMEEIEKRGLTLLAHDYRISGQPGEAIVRCSDRFRAAGDPFVNLYRKGYIGTLTVVAERTALLDAGGFDETLLTAQDFDLWLKVLADKNANFWVADKPLAAYALSPTGITSKTERRIACTLKIAKRHYNQLILRRENAFQHLIFRIAAIHKEAFDVYWRRGAYFRAALLIPRLGITLLRSLAEVILRKTR